MKKLALLLTAVFCGLYINAQENLDYFLPSDVSYDKTISTLIVYKSAAARAAKNQLVRTKFKTLLKRDSTRYLSYSERNKEQSINSISGAIFNTMLDITHRFVLDIITII